MLREIWLNIELERIDTHEGIRVKVLLDSGVTEMFIDKKQQQDMGLSCKSWIDQWQ